MFITVTINDYYFVVGVVGAVPTATIGVGVTITTELVFVGFSSILLWLSVTFEGSSSVATLRSLFGLHSGLRSRIAANCFATTRVKCLLVTSCC